MPYSFSALSAHLAAGAAIATVGDVSYEEPPAVIFTTAILPVAFASAFAVAEEPPPPEMVTAAFAV